MTHIEGNNMKLYQKSGYNRLAKLISLLGVVLTYIILTVIEYSVQTEEALIVFPIMSILSGLGTFLLTRLVYWVIDGFNESKNESI